LKKKKKGKALKNLKLGGGGLLHWKKTDHEEVALRERKKGAPGGGGKKGMPQNILRQIAAFRRKEIRMEKKTITKSK